MEEWKEYRLGDISSMKYGKLPPTSNGGIYPVWSGYRNVGTANTMNCSKGTMVVVARGVGGTGDVKIAKEDCYLTNLSIAVILDESICNPYYLHYKYLLNNLKYLDSGSAQSQITIDDLKRLTIKLPPLDYQNQIVAVLKSFDDKIECNQLINDNFTLSFLLLTYFVLWLLKLRNDNLQHQADALFKSFFVDFELFREGGFIETELGLIPKNWKILSFGDFIVALTEKAPVDSLPEYSVTNNGIIPRDTKFNKKLSKSSSMNKVLRKNNLVFGMSREILNWGIMEDEIGGVSSAYNIYKIDEDLVDPNYLRLYMKAKIAEFNSLIGMAAREGQSLDKGQLMQKKIYVPKKDVLQDFFAHYVPIMESIHNAEQESSRLAQLRDALLPKLMSGELKIS